MNKLNLSLIPDLPGVYLMKDSQSEIIYVGKAKSLIKRVKSYFSGKSSDRKTASLVENIESIETIITDSDYEAYLLENNLIKQHQPKYNILFKDDKTYPYIKITSNEDYPRIVKVRKRVSDGGIYFGPFTEETHIYRLINTIREFFGIRFCKQKLRKDKLLQRGCLNCRIGKCQSPCTGAMSYEEYQERVKETIAFLKGDVSLVEETLQEKMIKASQEMKYELALLCRNRLESLKKLNFQQKIESGLARDCDILGYAETETKSSVFVFLVRGGRITGHLSKIVARLQTSGEIIESFLKQHFLSGKIDIPSEIVIPFELEHQKELQDIFTEIQKRKVSLFTRKMGIKKGIVELAAQNAMNSLKREEMLSDNLIELTELKDELCLNFLPEKIVCFDISNLGDSIAVGSMVFFTRGKPDKKNYRKFKIKTVQGQNDFEMMAEIVGRYLQKTRDSNWPLADLIVVDGGKGQLSSTYEILEKMGFSDTTLISLAKQNEEVYFPRRKDPVAWGKDNKKLYILHRIRDEAHRFGITYLRSLAGKKLVHCWLDDVNGVGLVLKKKLLDYFGTLEKIKLASVEELEKVSGISHEVAQTIYLTNH